MPATKDQYAQAYKKAKQFAPKEWEPKEPKEYQYSQTHINPQRLGMKPQPGKESEFDLLVEEELWNS